MSVKATLYYYNIFQKGVVNLHYIIILLIHNIFNVILILLFFLHTHLTPIYIVILLIYNIILLIDNIF